MRARIVFIDPPRECSQNSLEINYEQWVNSSFSSIINFKLVLILTILNLVQNNLAVGCYKGCRFKVVEHNNKSKVIKDLCLNYRLKQK